MDIVKAPKPPKTFEEQLNILISRGLLVKDRAFAINALSNINYYRLRGYYIHLQEKGSDNFVNGVTIEKLVDIHNFDTKLRLLCLSLYLI